MKNRAEYKDHVSPADFFDAPQKAVTAASLARRLAPACLPFGDNMTKDFEKAISGP